MLGLKLNHVSKRGHRGRWIIQASVITIMDQSSQNSWWQHDAYRITGPLQGNLSVTGGFPSQ